MFEPSQEAVHIRMLSGPKQLHIFWFHIPSRAATSYTLNRPQHDIDVDLGLYILELLQTQKNIGNYV